MPKATKETVPEQPQTKVLNGVTLRQVPSHMVIPTSLVGQTNLSVIHRLTLLLFMTLCAYEVDGIFEGALDELQYVIETDYKTLRNIVNDLEAAGYLTIERRKGLPSRYSIPEGLGRPGQDVHWLSTGDGDWKKPYRW